MGGPAGVVIVILLIIGACIQVAVNLHHKYIETRQGAERDADTITSELELQLQSELEDAIKSSTAFFSPTKQDLKGQPPQYSHPDTTTKVQFADENNDVTSWKAFKLDGRTKLKQLARTILPKPELQKDFSNDFISTDNGISESQHQPDGGFSSYERASMHLQLPLPVSIGPLGDEKAVLVNAKQYNRIVKRRLARQLIEQYFRSRPQGKNPDLRSHGVHGSMRRPRGPGGRYLTLEEISQMESGMLLNSERAVVV